MQPEVRKELTIRGHVAALLLQHAANSEIHTLGATAVGVGNRLKFRVSRRLLCRKFALIIVAIGYTSREVARSIRRRLNSFIAVIKSLTLTGFFR